MPLQPKPIKVVHIASGDLWAGAEVQLFTLATALKDHTPTDIHVILMNEGALAEKLRAENIPVYVIDERTHNALAILREIYRLLKQIRPDIVHTHREKENTLGGLAALLAGNIPSLRTVHGGAEHKAAWHQLHKQLPQILNRAIGKYLQKKIIAVTADLAAQLSAYYRQDQLVVIENGVNVQSIEHAAQQHRHPLKLANGTRHIGFAGRLVPVKRVDLVIRTAAYLKLNHPELDAHFHIYGDGPLADSLKQLCLAESLGDIVTFEGHHANLAQKLSELDLLLITSDHEGLPMILLEALTLQVPVVAHAVGGMKTVLNNELSNLLVTEHTPQGYGEKIYQLLTLACDKMRSLKAQCSERVQAQYSSRQNALAVYNLYQSIR